MGELRMKVKGKSFSVLILKLEYFKYLFSQNQTTRPGTLGTFLTDLLSL